MFYYQFFILLIYKKNKKLIIKSFDKSIIDAPLINTKKRTKMTMSNKLLIIMQQNYPLEFTLKDAYQYIRTVGFAGESSIRSAIRGWTKKGICENIRRGVYKFSKTVSLVNTPTNQKNDQIDSQNEDQFDCNNFDTLVKSYRAKYKKNIRKPIGEAGEDIVVNMACKRCNKFCNKKMKQNTKGYDIKCDNCGQKTQVKTSKSISVKNDIIDHISGATYSATVDSLKQNVDYICLRYDYNKENDIYTLKWYCYIKFEDVTIDNIIKRNNPVKGRYLCNLKNLQVSEIYDY